VKHNYYLKPLVIYSIPALSPRLIESLFYSYMMNTQPQFNLYNTVLCIV
jgi:hypothetical protein